MTNADLCPCGSQQSFLTCCAPLINRQYPAPTAAALMRARYSAHALAANQSHCIDYLMDTWAEDQRGYINRQQVADWAINSEWLGLDVVEHKTAGDLATVEFVAHYKHDGKQHSHHELSRFHRDSGHWYFVDGEEVASKKTNTSTTHKHLGRNDSCPCGSGKKFKRCCINKC